MEPRLKNITVDPQDLWRALTTPHMLQPLFEGEKGIPNGAVVRSVNVDYTTGRVAITLEHPSFPKVKELGKIQEVMMTVYKEVDGGIEAIRGVEGFWREGER